MPLTVFVDILVGQALLLLRQGAEQGGKEARIAGVARVPACVFGGAAEVVIFGTIAAGGVGAAVCHFIQKRGPPHVSWKLWAACSFGVLSREVVGQDIRIGRNEKDILLPPISVVRRVSPSQLVDSSKACFPFPYGF